MYGMVQNIDRTGLNRTVRLDWKGIPFVTELDSNFVYVSTYRFLFPVTKYRLNTQLDIAKLLQSMNRIGQSTLTTIRVLVISLLKTRTNQSERSSSFQSSSIQLSSAVEYQLRSDFMLMERGFFQAQKCAIAQAGMGIQVAGIHL